MAEWFGLGIMIQVRDFASHGLLQVRSAFASTQQTIDNFSSQSSASLQQLSNNAEEHFQSLALSGLGIQQAGSQFLSFSNSLLNPLKSLGGQVVKTSAQFENWKKTLKALYKEEEIASQKLEWGMKLAAETPFEVSDVTQALIAFKAIGAEADTVLTSTNGVKQSILEFVGDLASLRPDVGLDGVMMGVRNLIGGDGGKSLTMRLDMDLETILGRSWGDTTEQIMQDLADVSGKIANGLMGELEGTWDQIISNLEDQFVRFQKAIGDAGMFEGVKKTLMYFSDIINDIDDDKMTRIGKNLTEAFNMIWKPVDLVAKALSKVVAIIIELGASNSFLGKLVAGFLAIGGAVTGLIGVVLTFGGGLITTISSLGLFIIALRNANTPILNVRSALQLLKTSLLGALSSVASLAGAFALGFAVWKFDIGGIRTMAMNFVNTILYAFQQSAKISRMGANDMIKAVSQLDMTNFGDRLTYRLLQLRVLWQAVCESWNDYTLSDETFRKVQALGLLPLLNAILDFKMKFEAFWSGFTEGFKDIADTISYVFKKVAEAVEKVYTFIFPVKKTIKETKDAVGEELNLAPWKAFGYILGGLAGIFATGMIATKIWGIIKGIGSLGLAIIRLPFKIFEIGGTAIELLLKGVGKLGGIFSKVFPWVANFASKLMTLAMAHPILALIALVLASLIPIFIKLWTESESFREGVIAMGTNILSIMGMVALGIGAVVGAIVLAVTSIVLIIAQILATIVVVIGSIIAVVVTIIGSVVAVITGIIATGIATAITIITLIVATVQTVCTVIQGIFQTAFAIVQGIIQTFLAIVKAVMTGDFTTLGATIKGIWQGVGTKIGEIWQGVATKVKSIWTGVQSFLSGVWGTMKSLWTGICNGIKTAGTTVVSGIKSAWNGVTGFFSGIWSGIKNGAKGMFDWISEKFSWLSGKITSAKEAMSKIGNGINSVFGSKKDGSHANGLSYVPYDGYIAELHKGEMVLTAQESKKYRQQGRGVLDNLLSDTPIPTDNKQNKNITPKEQKEKVSESKVTELLMPQLNMTSYVQPQKDQEKPQDNILGTMQSMLGRMLPTNKQEVVPSVQGEDNTLLQQNILRGVQDIVGGIPLSPQNINITQDPVIMLEGVLANTPLNSNNITLNPTESKQDVLVVLQDMKNLMSLLVTMKDRNTTEGTYVQPLDNAPTMKILTSIGETLSNLALPKEAVKQTLESPVISPSVNVNNTLTPNFNINPVVKGIENPVYNQLVTNNHSMVQTLNTHNNPIENNVVQTERPIVIAPQKEEDNKSHIVLQDNRGANPILAQTPTKQSNNTPQNIDSSITFSKGSIQINVQNGSDLDLNKIAKQLMEKIQREQQLRNTLRYKNA